MTRSPQHSKEQRLKAMEDKSQSQQKKKELEAQREEDERHLSECERQIAKQELQDEKAKVIKRQMESVRHVAHALDQICELQKHDVRRSLDRQVSDIWNDAAVKDYTASVSQHFRLELHKQVGGTRQPVHGASTGEKQVLALSFVGALVERAKRNAERAKHSKDTTELIVGDNYPLVMDSPFGSLEPDYQRKIAEWIPRLANQGGGHGIEVPVVVPGRERIPSTHWKRVHSRASYAERRDRSER